MINGHGISWLRDAHLFASKPFEQFAKLAVKIHVRFDSKKNGKGDPIGSPFRFVLPYMIWFGAVETRHVASLHVPKSFHSFNDGHTLCADAVFGSDADHVHAGVELGHVDDLLVAFDSFIVNNLTED